MRGKLPKHEIGSGNVFADVGLPDAELHLLKAEIVNCIDDILKERRLTQAAAAPHGHQPAGRLEDAARPLPRLQPGAAADLSGCVGQDVTIDVRRRARGKAGSIRIAA